MEDLHDSRISCGVNLEEGRVRIVGENNAVTVSTADVLCTNGGIHIVGVLLIPQLPVAFQPFGLVSLERIFRLICFQALIWHIR